jgi:aminoglycoside phosphotransferase (APT) family kinase protein
LARPGHNLEKVTVLERIRAVGLPAPAILASDYSPTMDREPGWLLEEWKPGSFHPGEMSHAEILATVADLGRHLRRLHTINTKGFGQIISGELDTPYQTFEAWLDQSYYSVIETCAVGAVSEATLPVLEGAYRLLCKSFAGPPVLCHGDLSSGNLLFDEGQLMGIIDWEFASGGDPAYDLAVFLTNVSPFWHTAQDEIMSALLQAYGANGSDNFYNRVLAHRTLFAATELVKPVHRSNPKYLDACRSILLDACSFKTKEAIY